MGRKGEDWLMAPVLKNMITYDKLIDGTIGLEDLAIMHEAMDVEAENSARVHQYLSEKSKRG